MAGQEGSNNNKCEALIPKFDYKRPDGLREIFPNTDSLFEPQVVSLGPVHHKKKKILVTEKDKRDIMEVLVGNKAGVFDEEMKIALGKARDLYKREELDEMMKPDVSDEMMKPYDFDEMMILDACFIIHAIDYITKVKSEVGKSKWLDERPHLLPLILKDMFLLENQVPIMVLEAAMKVLGRNYPKDIDKFIKEIAQSPKGAPTFLDRLMDLPRPIQLLAFLLFVLSKPLMLLVILVVVLPLALLILLVACLPLGLVCLLCQKRCTEPQGGKDTEKEGDLEQGAKEGSNENEESNEEECVKPSHLVHLLRAHLLGCSKKNQHTATNHNMWLPPRRATELTDAGIKFQRSPTSFVKDVTFRKGVMHGHLYLPSLARLTKTRLVNLMVHELCQGVSGHGITSYVSFLDGLIDCPEDVKELRSTQILPKALGDDQEVTSFFNKVGSFLAPFADHDVLMGIENHCQSPWRPSTVKFYDKHFSSPWTAVSLLIAILLFAVTIATAYKSIFG